MKYKLALSFVIILAGSFLSGYFGPWWAPAVFIVLASAMIGMSGGHAMIVGSVSLGLIFMIMAAWMGARDQAGIIEKTGMLLGGLSPVMMNVVTTMTGAVTGLLSGWLGSALGQIIPMK